MPFFNDFSKGGYFIHELLLPFVIKNKRH
ncbi:hypothetical protein ELI_3945 [Eubacterium callanderi]|uniref:Uncharacterized protein n=1 Tax=Eubacterium callanderi TaxID=53442 RepID=E3GGT4_9FIRM|nr:hypothetical protein ELI_3945 [Eubacterium callanderi]